jgi:hypothetical protein
MLFEEVFMLLVKTSIRPSTIHGLGCFAAQFIQKGTEVWAFHPPFDVVYTRKQVNALPAPARKRVDEWGYQDEDG